MGTMLTFLPGVATDRQDLTTDKTMDCIKSLSQGPRGVYKKHDLGQKGTLKYGFQRTASSRSLLGYDNDYERVERNPFRSPTRS